MGKEVENLPPAWETQEELEALVDRLLREEFQEPLEYLWNDPCDDVEHAWVQDCAIPDLRALIETFQERAGRNALYAERLGADVEAKDRLVLRVRRCAIESCDCKGLDIGVTLSTRAATFGSAAWFGAATFGGLARFDRATFGGAARFSAATFGGEAGFGAATFGGAAWFDRATFGGEAWFDRATFGGAARFDRATFGGEAWFDRATFGGAARFGAATFGGLVWFGAAIFARAAGFDRATCGSAAGFGAATFGGAARFGAATFGGLAGFGAATISKRMGFDGAVIERVLSFSHSEIAHVVELHGARFVQIGDQLRDDTISTHAGRLALADVVMRPGASFTIPPYVVKRVGRPSLADTVSTYDSMLVLWLAWTVEYVCVALWPLWRVLGPARVLLPVLRPLTTPMRGVGRWASMTSGFYSRGVFLSGEDSEDHDSILSAAKQYNVLRDVLRAQPGADEQEDRCHFRYMDLTRRAAAAKPKKTLLEAARLTFEFWVYRNALGYLIESKRILVTGLVVVLGFALLFGLGFEARGTEWILYTPSAVDAGGVAIDSELLTRSEWGDGWHAVGSSVYFSIMTFVTLGYGDFAPVGGAKIWAGIEAFLGVTLIALFTVAWGRKMIR